jgi:hypothetical protein
MPKDNPITEYLTPDEQAMLTPAAKELTAADLITALWQFKHKDDPKPVPQGRPKLTEKADALTMKDWESVARAFVAQAMRRHMN